MTEPLQPLPQPPPGSFGDTSANIPLLAKQMQEQIDQLIKNLQALLQEPSVSISDTFQKQLATNIIQLNQTSEKAMKLR